MSKIFISYKRVDRSKAGIVRKKLEELRVPLFIDEEIPATEHFASAINEHLSTASAVLVLWTAAAAKLPKPGSGETNWVIAEAYYGLDRHMLVGTCIEKMPSGTLPVPFNTLQAPDISDWFDTGTPAQHRSWQHVLKALGTLINRPALADVAVILEQEDPEAKRAFVRNHPDDPLAERFADELERQARREFEEQFQKAQVRIDRRQAAAEKKLTESRADFDRQVAEIRSGHVVMAPDPISAIKDNVSMLREETTILRVELKEQQSRNREAEGRIKESTDNVAALDRELVASRAENEKRAEQIVALNAEIAESKATLAKKDRQIESSVAEATVSAKRNGRIRGRLLAAAVVVAALIGGLALGPVFRGAIGDTPAPGDLARQQQDLVAQKAAADERDAALKRNADALAKRRADLEAIAAQQKESVDQISRAKAELAAQKQDLAQREQAVADRERKALEPKATASVPPAPASQSASQCDLWAAYQFDPDLPVGSKFQDNMAAIPIDNALSACSEALRTAGDDKILKRRLMLELGRVYAAQGRSLALAANERAAKDSYAKAVQWWNGATSLGSGQAYNVLGSYYQGSFAVDRPPPQTRFDPQPQSLSQAWQDYSAAAKLGNPGGLVNAGVVLIGLDESFDQIVPRDVAKGRSYLEAARALGFPRATFKIGDAKRTGRGYPKDVDEGVRLIGEALCKGDELARQFFDDQKNKLNKPACPAPSL